MKVERNGREEAEMNKKELNFILQAGEGLKIEFKERFDPKTLAVAGVAFANSSGGRIFLGIDDKRTVKGINITNKIKSQIQDIAGNCDPKIKILLREFKRILIVEVEEGEDKPYRCSQGFYLREGANSQKLSRDEIVKFVVKSGKAKFGEQINRRFKFPADFDKKKFLDFLKKSNISKVISPKEILINLSLAGFLKRTFKLNNAGVLLFAVEPEKFFRNNLITCVLYKGKERLNIIDRKDFKNDLLTNYEDSLNFLKQHLMLRYVIKGTGPRSEVLELPEESLRESLLNAIVHRDYFEEKFGIFVEIFDNRLEITNAGRLLFDKKKLGKISFSRNPLLFDVFYRLRLIEKVGSGINRIKDLVKKRKLRVKFEVDDFFRIVFFRPPISKKKNGTVNGTVNERLSNLIGYLKKSKKITTQNYIKLSGVSLRTARRDLALFRKQKIIEFVGVPKKGYYIYTEKNRAAKSS